MSRNRSVTLAVEITGYWHAGSGRGAGHHLDAVCERDAVGLPVLPGKQLKGLLRQALARAEVWGWFGNGMLPPGPMESLENLLFGSGPQESGRYDTRPGMLQVHSARLPVAERQWLARPEQSALRQALFGELFSTAIDERTGSAKQGSLRGLEVAMPMTLEAELALQVTALEPALREQQATWLANPDAWQPLQEAAALIDAVGAHRSRGLGEARLHLSAESKGAGA